MLAQQTTQLSGNPLCLCSMGCKSVSGLSLYSGGAKSDFCTVLVTYSDRASHGSLETPQFHSFPSPAYRLFQVGSTKQTSNRMVENTVVVLMTSSKREMTRVLCPLPLPSLESVLSMLQGFPMQVHGARNPRCKDCFLSPLTFRVNRQACLPTKDGALLGFSNTTLP